MLVIFKNRKERGSSIEITCEESKFSNAMGIERANCRCKAKDFSTNFKLGDEASSRVHSTFERCE